MQEAFYLKNWLVVFIPSQFIGFIYSHIFLYICPTLVSVILNKRKWDLVEVGS